MSGPPSSRPPSEDAPQPDRPRSGTPRSDAPKPRPWYMLGATALMWLMGVATMLNGCEEMEYLRGSKEVHKKLARDAEEATHPMARTLVVRKGAWIEALGKNHERGFPVAALRTLVAVVLVAGAGGALVGRKSSRTLVLQAIAAHVVAGGVAFWLLSPVRLATADAVARDAVANEVTIPQGKTRSLVLDEQRVIALQRERSMAVVELLIFGAAAFALTRRRTKEYFASLPESVTDAPP